MTKTGQTAKLQLRIQTHRTKISLIDYDTFNPVCSMQTVADDREKAEKIVTAVNNFDAMREALEDICDGASWSLGGIRRRIADVDAEKIERARAVLKAAEGEK